MTLDRRAFLATAPSFLALPRHSAYAAIPGSVSPDRLPWGAVPSPRQQAWQAMRQYAFIHFGINTFTDREWGFGDEQPALFNPTDFSADQIVLAVRDGGLKGLVLTAKHHDGFCLWPTQLTEHCIRNSPFRGGKGDVVGEISAACQRHGIRFGVYLSPWDRNRADYGRPSYLDYYRAQLRELMTRYGPVFEVWFDEANGGDGYYGGARETRRIDGKTYYDWPRTWQIVRDLQPQAIIWGPVGSDGRWIGNEAGIAGEPCRATMNRGMPTTPQLAHGVKDGPIWWPAEVDVSIRAGWFWHEDENDTVMSVRRLVQLSFESVGRGTNLILNMPPDTRGRIPDLDAHRIQRWNAVWSAAEVANAALGATVEASSSASGDATVVLDPQAGRYWCAAAISATLTLRLPTARRFDVVRLREFIPLGQRVNAFSVDVDRAGTGSWETVGHGEAIGSQRLLRLPSPVEAHAVRVIFTDASAPPAIADMALLLLPHVPDEPVITRNAEGLVTLTAVEPRIVFTRDGTTPVLRSPLYEGPFPLPNGGVVQAAAVLPDGQIGPVAQRRFGPSKARWTIVDASAPGAAALIDENARTTWQAPISATSLPEVTIDFGQVLSIGLMTLQPAKMLPVGSAPPARFSLSARLSDGTWAVLLANGEFSNIAASAATQRILLPNHVETRAVRLRITSAAGDLPAIAFSELGFE